jgi:hypothetical protein
LNIETRDDAVRWLEEQGFPASKRDWSFGETVIVAAGKTVVSGIVTLQLPLCIHQKAGAWAISDFSSAKIESIDCQSLQEATQKVAAMYSEKLIR